MARKVIKKKKQGNRAPLIIALVLGLAVLAGGFAIMSGGSRGSNGAGKPITISPDPIAIDSVQKRLEEFRGKVVVLDFWATWCGPCRSEIPGLIALQEKYRNEGVEIIGVSLDILSPRGPNGGAGAVEPFMKRFGINYTIWMLNNASGLDGYDVTRGIPTKYVLDRNGNVQRTYVGAQSSSVVEKDIQNLL